MGATAAEAGGGEDGAQGGAPVEFWFDFSSPFAYLASQRIDELCALYGREVDWRPLLLGAVFQRTGAVSPAGLPLKGDYSNRDLHRCARAMGLPVAYPPNFPFLSVTPARALCWLKDRDADLARRVGRRLFAACFGEGRDISGAPALLEIAAGEGADAAALEEGLGADATKRRFREEVEAGLAAGVCGAPFFIVDGEPFWGADRLDQVERWLATGGW